MANDEEREFRLRPRKPAARSERRVLATAYKIDHALCSHERRAKAPVFGRRARNAHGHTSSDALSASSTARMHLPGSGEHMGAILCAKASRSMAVPRGWDSMGRANQLEIAQRLESWQRAGDERLWKIIVSPEFGDRADLKTVDSRSVVEDGEGSRNSARMGGGSALQHGTPARSRGASRRRRRRPPTSPQPGLRPGRHPRNRCRSLHPPAWVSLAVGRRRRPASGGASTSLHFTRPGHQALTECRRKMGPRHCSRCCWTRIRGSSTAMRG